MYETKSFNPVPIQVAVYEAPYRVVLEIGFKSMGSVGIDYPVFNNFSIKSQVDINTKTAAREVVKELRAAADEIEKYTEKIYKD